jgi:hypothetical protein
LAAGQRHRQQGASCHPRAPVDTTVEARISGGVVDTQRLAALQNRAGNAAVRWEAQVAQLGGRRRILLRHIGKVQLVTCRVEEQDCSPFCVESVAALRHHHWNQLVERDAFGECAPQLV